MHSFRLLTDALLLHLAQKPLLVLAVVFVLILAVTAVLVRRRLHDSKAPAQPQPEEDACC